MQSFRPNSNSYIHSNCKTTTAKCEQHSSLKYWWFTGVNTEGVSLWVWLTKHTQNTSLSGTCSSQHKNLISTKYLMYSDDWKWVTMKHRRYTVKGHRTKPECVCYAETWTSLYLLSSLCDAGSCTSACTSHVAFPLEHSENEATWSKRKQNSNISLVHITNSPPQHPLQNITPAYLPKLSQRWWNFLVAHAHNTHYTTLHHFLEAGGTPCCSCLCTTPTKWLQLYHPDPTFLKAYRTPSWCPAG